MTGHLSPMWSGRSQSLRLFCRFDISVFKRGRVCLANAPDAKLKSLNDVSDFVGHSSECRIAVNDKLFNALLDAALMFLPFARALFFLHFRTKSLNHWNISIWTLSVQVIRHSLITDMLMLTLGVLELLFLLFVCF